jgi:hypothetical protein
MVRWIFSGAFFFIFSLASLGIHTAESAALPLEGIPFHTLFTRPIAYHLHLSEEEEEASLETKALALCHKYPPYKTQAILVSTQHYHACVQTVDEDGGSIPTTLHHILTIIGRLDQFEEKYPHGLGVFPHMRYSSAWTSIFLLQQCFRYAPFADQLAYLDLFDQVFEKMRESHFHATVTISWASAFFQQGLHTSEDLGNIIDVVQKYVLKNQENSSFRLHDVLRTARQEHWNIYTTATQLAWHLAD